MVLIKKKSGVGRKIPKEILSLKSKRINYVAEDFEEFLSAQAVDNSAFVKLVPVNYYAVKNAYIEGQFFYSKDYSECHVMFRYYENDKSISESGLFDIKTDDLVKAFAKVGIIVTIPDKNE